MRLLVLAHDAFPSRAKTAYSVLKYAYDGWSDDEIIAVIDRASAGQDAGALVGAMGEGIPIVKSAAEGLALGGAEVLIIGIAPAGGALPQAWRADIEEALKAGLTVVSGLHTPLNVDAALASLACEHGGKITDVRHQHPPQRITDGSGLGVDALVVLHVGTDCNSGKMTSAVELTREARSRGIHSGFVATGQTGIMIGCDAGAPIDALVSDFVAGAVEQCVLNAAQVGAPDIIFVEGQGSLTHPAYAGVTASLLHGAFPDVLVLADEPRREFLTLPPGPVKFVKPSAQRERDLNEAHLMTTSRARVGAAALVTRGLSQEEYEAEVAVAERELGVPAGDVFRGDAGKILDAVLAQARRIGLWDDNGFVRGVKPKRLVEAPK